MVSNDVGVEGSGNVAAGVQPLDFNDCSSTLGLRKGDLKHGASHRSASALAVISAKGKYWLVRSIKLGSDRDYFDALFEALIADTAMEGTGSATNRSPSIEEAVSPTGDGGRMADRVDHMCE
ncbi:hypothetical protein Pmar_PMAR004443 [Perkinsus marinus ATCC 50983]|uniref:Uncharacterized protein n=1 Tax=Perkinsus marinus (strain ATCC 50983 / TXsc) TaxID=423536 RepID=C5LZN8_PERM5|nr:hypothetical protein Pmar_PMAR004443 [Perkinsus marinus ATCC 50983]EEQ97706.1 hypothetical protein Pmar_PMAR004443 [Perkinsus marinus ATCC 50983]|eukprot:XP_002764989.1 hypothetical protein Pmar_PMAR004443 [Perkinsus marinus ATCC 50983]